MQPAVRTIDLLARRQKEIKADRTLQSRARHFRSREGHVAADRDEDRRPRLSVSLYGKTLRPTDRMLEGLDALVFDIQDAGVRFYKPTLPPCVCDGGGVRRASRSLSSSVTNPLNASVVQDLPGQGAESFHGYFRCQCATA